MPLPSGARQSIKKGWGQSVTFLVWIMAFGFQCFDAVGWMTRRAFTITTTPQPFYGPFSGTTWVSWCRKRTSGFYGAREIKRGRHTDHPAGRHSVRTNQCPPPPSPDIFYGPDALPAAQPTVSKH